MSELNVIKKEQITHTQLVKYAGASGDFNPIHTVVPTAKQLGLKDVIAHGMLIMGMAGEALTTWFHHEQLKEFKVRFSKMTFPGEKLSIHGSVGARYEVDNDYFQKGTIQVKNEDGEIKLKGTFVIKSFETES